MVPSSTYRVQLHKGFTFKELKAIIPYLHTLGISTIYAAPILSAAPGSMHGYDVIDPDTINPEIGTLDELVELSEMLKQLSMTWLQDIVPNHMAFSPLNSRVYDVLERGPASEYYNYFDIDWEHASMEGKVMLPFLAQDIAAAIKGNELKVGVAPHGLVIRNGETSYPVSANGYQFIVSLSENQTTLNGDLTRWIDASLTLPLEQWSRFKEQWCSEVFSDVNKRNLFENAVHAVNADDRKLSALLDNQFYSLCGWKKAQREINYRRFFTVNSLIGLRMEDETVFNNYHRFLFSLYRKGIIQGFRIDHIDGLSDPAGYLQNLRKAVGDSCFIVAEKILEEGEEMPDTWPLQGTSGYEFLSIANQLLTRKSGARVMLEFYKKLVPSLPDYTTLVAQNKRLILEEHMAGEWNNLVKHLVKLNPDGALKQDRLKQALGSLMISFPVYRIYPEKLPLFGKALSFMDQAFDLAFKAQPDVTEELTYLQKLVTQIPLSVAQERNILLFFRRFMQFTGPLMAKGVEDTTFYAYNPLLSHDEVGDTPDHLGISVSELHEKLTTRFMRSPLSLNATATHDTKRGEDVRVRLNVLTELAPAWTQSVDNWFKMNVPGHETGVRRSPDANDEYFIYQNIIGGLPQNFEVDDTFIKRLQEYFVKAVREAKINSSWENPDKAYEDEGCHFIAAILSERNGFLAEAITFSKKVAVYASTYSLVQTLLKCTAPGIPDIYQGCELWDLSFVDPDNRRPVDYSLRGSLLDQMILLEHDPDALYNFLRTNADVGALKLFLVHKILNYRRHNLLLFSSGEYVPLKVVPDNSLGVVFARRAAGKWLIVVCPHNVSRYEGDMATIIVPTDDFPELWRNVLTGEHWSTPELSFNKLLSKFPVAVLESLA